MASVTSATGAASAASQTALSNKTLAQNFTTFLTLLTTQLKNQNPLDPLDTNQFTQQLVQFASVEQQMKTNDSLSSLVSLADSSRLASATGLIGRSVVADGTSSQLSGGKAVWHLSVDKNAPNTTIAVKDEAGNEVFSTKLSLSQGQQAFTWDGTKNDGTRALDGFYSIVAVAQDASGKALAVSTDIQAVVSGVSITNGEAALSMGNQKVPLKSVKSIVEQ